MRKMIAWRLAAMVICMSMLCGCGNSRVTNEIEETAFGVDVAKYQGTIDWPLLAASGVDFAMVRIGYRTLSDGIIEEDSNGRYNLQEGSKAGIPMGVYFFSTAISPEEAREEAQWVADDIAQYPITYPVVYDCERFMEPDSRQYGMTREERTEAALAFLKTIEQLGYEGMFYASKNELESAWDIEKIEKKYKIWVAQYPVQAYPATPQSSYEGEHHMWQYTKEGTAAGIEPYVDLNVAYFGYDGIEPPKDNRPPAEVSPDPEALMAFTDTMELVTAKDETNLRDIPSQDAQSNVMVVLQNGETAQRIAISDSGWSKLLYQGKVYYAVTSYLTTALEGAGAAGDSDGDGIKTQFNDADELVTAKDLTNLRSIPSSTREDSEIYHKLKHGEVAVCTGISDNGWARLEFGGKTCYAIYRLLMPYSEVADGDGEDVGMAFADVQDSVTPAKSVNLRSVPNTASDGSIVVKVYNGEVLRRIGINKEMGWSKVLYHGQILYCANMHLTEIGD